MNTESSFKLTRYAPTPSGFLHLGNLYSFVLTALLAQKYGAKILLRIDDLDRARVEDEYVQDIFDTLEHMELPWHVGPRNMEEYKNKFSQVHRMPLYATALDHLARNGQLYACACSRAEIWASNEAGYYLGTCEHKQIALETEGMCWRIRTRDNACMSIRTLTGRQDVIFPESMHDFMVRKKNAYPAYQLSTVVDDIHFGVDLVVRGEDLWESTLAQLYLASQLPANSYGEAVFYHHPLINDVDGEKLSKSAGATSIQYLRKQGLSAANIYTVLAERIGVPEPLTSWQAFEPWVALL